LIVRNYTLTRKHDTHHIPIQFLSERIGQIGGKSIQASRKPIQANSSHPEIPGHQSAPPVW
jgi:hypothetical protein